MKDVERGGDPVWTMREHYIVCHWNEHAPEIIRELRNHERLVRGKAGEHQIPIVVLTRKPIETGMLDKIGFGARDSDPDRRGSATMDIYFRPADPGRPTALRQVNAATAKSIVILADDSSRSDADARSLQCLMALRSILPNRPYDPALGGHRSGFPHVVVEIVDPSSFPKFNMFKEDFHDQLEILRGESLRTRILAHAARTPGLVEFYTDLLTHDEASNEFYPLRVRPFFDRLAQGEGGDRPVTFSKVAVEIVDHFAGLGKAVIPVAIWRGGRIHLNPRRGEEAYDVRVDDEILVIAYDPPDGRDARTADASVVNVDDA